RCPQRARTSRRCSSFRSTIRCHRHHKSIATTRFVPCYGLPQLPTCCRPAESFLGAKIVLDDVEQQHRPGHHDPARESGAISSAGLSSPHWSCSRGPVLWTPRGTSLHCEPLRL